MPRVRKQAKPPTSTALVTSSAQIVRRSINLRALPSMTPASTSAGALVKYMFAGRPPQQDLWRSRYGRGLDLNVIETSLRQADWGNMRQITDLSRETIDCDPHLAAVLGKRFNAIASLPCEIVPAEGAGINEEKARFYADVVRNQIKQLPHFSQRVQQLAWALFDGRAALELEWFLVPTVPNLPVPVHDSFGTVNWMVKDVAWIHPRRLHFGPERELRVCDDFTAGDFSECGVALRDHKMKFIYWTPQLYGDYPEREGLARRVLYWSFFKRFSARERMILLELFGKPWRWLEVGEDSTASGEDLDNADDMLQNIGGNSSFRFPRGTNFKVEQPEKGAGELHQATIEQSNEEISKLVLGQTGTTDPNPAGLNNAQANVMQDEQFMILMNDARMISDVLETFLSDAIIELNFGPLELNHAPHLKLRADVPLDREKELKRLKAAVEAGLEIPLSEAYDISGFRQPKADEPVIRLDTPPLHPMAIQPPPERPVIAHPENANLPGRKMQPVAPSGEGGLPSPETPALQPKRQGGGGTAGGGGPSAGETAVGETPTDESTLPQLVAEAHSVVLPFAGFKDFDECLKEMKKQGHSQESASRICGALKRDHEGATAGLHQAHPSDLALIRVIVLHQAGIGCGGCGQVMLEDGDDEMSAVFGARQPEEAVVGSLETLIAKGVKEGARQTSVLASVYQDAVQGLEEASDVNKALERAHSDIDLYPLSRAIERRILHGIMSGAIASQYEFETQTVLPVAELEAMGGRRFNLAEPATDPNFVDRPLQDAVRWFKSKNVVTRTVFDQLEAAAKRRAFTIAGMTNNVMLQRAKDELEAQIRSGGQVRDFAKKVAERFESAGFTPASPSHVETIYRTNVLNAYNSGRYAQATQPEVLRVRPYWQIRTANDGPPRQRPAHRNVHLWVLKADDTFWRTAYPPFGFNCRCRVVTLSNAEVQARSLRIRTGGEVSGLPDRGFTSGVGSLL